MAKMNNFTAEEKNTQFCQAARDIERSEKVKTALILSPIAGGVLLYGGFATGMGATTALTTTFATVAAVSGLALIAAPVVIGVAAGGYAIYRHYNPNTTPATPSSIPTPPKGKTCVQYFLDEANGPIFTDSSGSNQILGSILQAIKKYPAVGEAVDLANDSMKHSQASIKYGLRGNRMEFFQLLEPSLELTR